MKSLLSQAWKDLDENEKQAFLDEAAEEKVRVQRALLVGACAITALRRSRQAAYLAALQALQPDSTLTMEDVEDDHDDVSNITIVELKGNLVNSARTRTLLL